jgi:rhodanese-related sulfurtransferase
VSDAAAQITVAELRLRKSDRVVILDVRSAAEFEEGHVHGARNIPASELPDHVAELRSASLVVTVCAKGGGRSEGAAAALRTLGLPDVRFLAGGTVAWIASRGEAARD